jgi:hypothetical protein
MDYSYERQVEIHKVISDWARYTIERLQKSIDKKHIGVTGSLRYSLLYQLAALANGGVESVKLEFNYYGKFLDMGVGRGQKIESVKSNREVYNLVGGGRKPKKWFSKTLWGEVAALTELLSVKYGDQGTRMIKESIQQIIPINL